MLYMIGRLLAIGLVTVKLTVNQIAMTQKTLVHLLDTGVWIGLLHQYQVKMDPGSPLEESGSL